MSLTSSVYSVFPSSLEESLGLGVWSPAIRSLSLYTPKTKHAYERDPRFGTLIAGDPHVVYQQRDKRF